MTPSLALKGPKRGGVKTLQKSLDFLGDGAHHWNGKCRRLRADTTLTKSTEVSSADG